MHAQYNSNEKIYDQYSIHRICQAYQLSKFINLMTCAHNRKESRELVILAGDLNTQAKDYPYFLLGIKFICVLLPTQTCYLFFL